MNEYINKIEKGPDKRELISNIDLKIYAGNGLNIVENTKITDSLEKMTDNKYNSVVILINGVGVNHWVLLSKINGRYEYFDSYGHSYKGDKYLKYHFKGYPIICNKIQYQKIDPNVNSCGKHVLMRLFTIKKFNFDLKQYKKFMSSLKKSGKETYDDIVSVFPVLS